MRQILFASLFSVLLSTPGSADYIFSPPATGTATNEVPIKIAKFPGSDLLLNYDLLLDFDLPDGVSLQTPPATETTNLNPPGNFGTFGTNTTNPAADLIVFGEALGDTTTLPDNLIGGGPFELARLLFDVDSSVPANTPLVFDLKPQSNLIYFTPTVANPLLETTLTFTISADTNCLLITPVPEPSQWFLGLMMTGLAGAIGVKRFLLNREN